MESNMTLIKKLERQLILEWHLVQLETVPEIKSIALKAYYMKLALYRKARAWSQELLAPL